MWRGPPCKVERWERGSYSHFPLTRATPDGPYNLYYELAAGKDAPPAGSETAAASGESGGGQKTPGDVHIEPFMRFCRDEAEDSIPRCDNVGAMYEVRVFRFPRGLKRPRATPPRKYIGCQRRNNTTTMRRWAASSMASEVQRVQVRILNERFSLV